MGDGRWEMGGGGREVGGEELKHRGSEGTESPEVRRGWERRSGRWEMGDGGREGGGGAEVRGFRGWVEGGE
jgi:hypothetical protein